MQTGSASDLLWSAGLYVLAPSAVARWPQPRPGVTEVIGLVVSERGTLAPTQAGRDSSDRFDGK